MSLIILISTCSCVTNETKIITNNERIESEKYAIKVTSIVLRKIDYYLTSLAVSSIILNFRLELAVSLAVDVKAVKTNLGGREVGI